MNNGLVSTNYSNNICYLSLNRPEKLNAFTPDMLNELEVKLKEIESRNDVQFVVLQGEGTSFSSGFDLNFANEENLKEEFTVFKKAQVIARIIRGSDKIYKFKVMP